MKEPNLNFIIIISILAMSLQACNFRKEKKSQETQAQEVKTSFASIQSSILAQKCIRCHNPSRTRGGIDLTSYKKIMETENLVVPGNAGASTLYTSVASGSMPRNDDKLSDVEIQAIKDWINSGALEGEPLPKPENTEDNTNDDGNNTPPDDGNNDGDSDGGNDGEDGNDNNPPPEKLDFQTVFNKVLKDRCFFCHGGAGGTEAEVNVSSYQNLIELNEYFFDNVVKPGKPDESVIIHSITEANPALRMPQDAPKLPQSEIDLIYQWIQNGAPETLP